MQAIPESRLLKLPPGILENIRKIHNLDKPGRAEEAINILEEWIQKQDHLVKKDFSKKYLETTLIACKGSVEKSKKQIDRLCTMKTLAPKFFSKTNVKMELQNILELACLAPLLTITDDYCRVIINKLKTKNVTPESFMQYYHYNIILAEYLKAYDYVNGFIIIVDLRQQNIFDLVSKINHSQLQQILTILIEGYGARLKGIHFITESKAVEMLVKIVRQFLSEKISNRVHVQPTLEDLHKVVPKEILPMEYGGTEGSVHKLEEAWLKELSSEEHVEYMKMMNKACTDETKRSVDEFNAEYMGMPGSFRNLRVD